MPRICLGPVALVNKRVVFTALTTPTTPLPTPTNTPTSTPTNTPTETTTELSQIIPDAPTSLEVWYDGADVNTYKPSATDEGTITQWTDKSNFAHNANSSGGVGARPSYENTILQNGNGYLEFVSGNVLTVNPFTSLQSAQHFTAFVVVKSNNLTQSNCIFTTDQGDLRFVISSSSLAVGMNGVNNFVSASATSGTTWNLYTIIYNGTEPVNSDKIILRKNKSQLSYNQVQGTIPSTFSASNTTLRIGQRADGTGQFIGYMGELILVNRPLTVSEYSDIENYLTSKWGL